MREFLRKATIISIKVISFGLPFAMAMTFIVGVGDDRPLVNLVKQTLMVGGGITALNCILSFYSGDKIR